MKATEKQKQICDVIKSQIEFWKTSNDIGSPTHYCDNEQAIEQLELPEDDTEYLINLIDNLLDFIKEQSKIIEAFKVEAGVWYDTEEEGSPR